MKKINYNKIFCYLITIIVCLIILFPILWLIPATFKTKQELWQIPNTFIPKNPTLNNYKLIFGLELNNYNFIRSMGYTLLVAVVSVVLSYAVNLTAAYAFARLEFRFKKVLWWIFLSTMFIPGLTTQLTSIRWVNILGLNDTLWVLILPGLVSGYGIFFYRQFFLNVPFSLEEAALLDGCSRFGIFIKIFIPLSSAPMVIIGMSCFMGHWNSYAWPSLVIVNNTEIAQVNQVIRILHANYRGEYGAVLAATFTASLVPIALFAMFQKQIIGGIAISGIK